MKTDFDLLEEYYFLFLLEFYSILFDFHGHIGEMSFLLACTSDHLIVGADQAIFQHTIAAHNCSVANDTIFDYTTAK